jgi:hypothetical protein
MPQKRTRKLNENSRRLSMRRRSVNNTREAALRTYRPRAKGSTHIQESIEIVE